MLGVGFVATLIKWHKCTRTHWLYYPEWKSVSAPCTQLHLEYGKIMKYLKLVLAISLFALRRPPLAAVSGAHRFQVSRPCLLMSTRSRSSVPIWLLPTCCLFQPSTTSFIVIVAATDSTNTTHNCRLWNSLPHVDTSAPTLAVFRKRLKAYLFSRSFAL